MTQKQSRASEKASLFNPNPAEFAATGRKRMEDFVNANTEFFDRLQDANRQWLNRLQTEANLASEFASRLSAARSIPDAMAVCQDWAGRRFELIAEDVKHVLDDSQKLMQTGARLLSNGWHSQVGPGP